MIKVNDMDKYQVTERMKMLKRMFEDPDTNISDMDKATYDEIINSPTDKEGFVHKYYLTDQAKFLIETVIEK